MFKKLVFLALLTYCSNIVADQSVVSTEEQEEVAVEQTEEITDLYRQLEALGQSTNEVKSKIQSLEQQLEATASFLDRQTEKPTSSLSIGGYGELHYNDLSARDSSKDLARVDFHRYVLFLDYDFSDTIHFFSELEIEHSVAGEGYPGEVELEQAYIQIDANENLNAKTGLFLVPVGILNETHEPTTFYGVERNDVESILIPSTWWEAGVLVSKQFHSGWSFDAAVHSGLEIPTTGSNAYRIRSGRQKVANAVANAHAYTIRSSFTGIPGVSISLSINQQSDASQLDSDSLDGGTLVNLNAVYRRNSFESRFVWASWNFDLCCTEETTPDTASTQTGWYIEPAWHSNFGDIPIVYHFRFENIEAVRPQDKFDEWEIGLNIFPHSGVVFKVDYRSRSHTLDSQRGRDFSGINLGVGYNF